jgi:prolyl 4-hydroxylase
MPIQPLGDRQSFFDNYLQGCLDAYGKKGHRCIPNEQDRVNMMARQIHSMRNYTEKGYAKIRAPEKVYSMLKEFWEKNKDRQKKENWGVGNIYVNHWDSPTTMVSVEDESLEGGGYVLKQHIWNAARYAM